MEPKAAITVVNNLPVRVVRHTSDMLQTRRGDSRANEANEATDNVDEALLNVDEEQFHSATSYPFNSSDHFDDEAAWRFSTNFVTPPSRQDKKSTTKPLQTQDSSTVIKSKTASSHMGKSKQQQDGCSACDATIVPSLSDVTSETTVESQSAASSTELATLIQSVSNELGQMSVSGPEKSEKQLKKKQKKG